MTFVMNCPFPSALIVFILITMNAFINKTILIGGCAVLVAIRGTTPFSIAALIATAALSFLSELINTHRIPLTTGALFVLTVLSWPYSEILSVLPLFAYTLAEEKKCLPASAFLFLVASMRLIQTATLETTLVVFVLCVFSVVLYWRSSGEQAAISRQHELEDTLSDKVLYLSTKNAELEEAREYIAQTATLTERTRIARDIHDNVGHILTRMNMQLEALKVIHASDDGSIREELESLSLELNQALTSMRNSVHMLADSAVDLQVELQSLVRQSGIKDATVSYRTEHDVPPVAVRALIAVTREALTNAINHGQATQAVVSVTEFPGFWQLSVKSNGTMPALPPHGHDLLASLSETGLGLRSMEERMERIGGTLHIAITETDRFIVTATIPKESS